jgi:hypothetical protein
VYNWDHGSENNPHLIKLQDATQYTSIFNVGSNGDIEYDPQLQYRPATPLCDSKSLNAERYGQASSGIAYCHNSRAPGFYSVLYYYDAAAPNFRLFTRAAQDYGSTTPFYIYTTTGYLNSVSSRAGVHTHKPADDSAARRASYFSNSVKFFNKDPTTYPDYRGDLSCETNGVGKNGARDCISKNDKLMILMPMSGTGSTTALNANPVYPNMYTVGKIYRERRSAVDDVTELLSQRLKMILDYSLNAAYTDSTTAATVYKFYPPTNTPFGGYKHTGACGTRGMCNTDTGLCECFNGYNCKDDCTCINNLVY